MDGLIISNIVLWIAVVVLALALYSLTRLIREFLATAAAHSAGGGSKGLPVGAAAPTFTERTVNGKEAAIAIGRPTFLLFTGAGCLVCEHVLHQLADRVDELRKFPGEFVIINDYVSGNAQSWIGHALADAARVVAESELYRLYRIPTFPHLVVVNSEGFIVSYGSVTAGKDVADEIRRVITPAQQAVGS